jgi:hypothetical protein
VRRIATILELMAMCLLIAAALLRLTLDDEIGLSASGMPVPRAVSEYAWYRGMRDVDGVPSASLGVNGCGTRLASNLAPSLAPLLAVPDRPLAPSYGRLVAAVRDAACAARPLCHRPLREIGRGLLPLLQVRVRRPHPLRRQDETLSPLEPCNTLTLTLIDESGVLILCAGKMLVNMLVNWLPPMLLVTCASTAHSTRPNT